MVQVGMIDYVYIAIIVIIIILMCFKKDIVFPSIIGTSIIGFLYSKSILSTLQIVFRAIVVSFREFVEIIIIISLVEAMSNALKDIGIDELMISPVKKLMVNSDAAFFVLGIIMTVSSYFLWPSPAAAFIGTVLAPAAVDAGISPVWAAVVINIFGNGIALSSDYFIQAAPSIVAKTSGVNDAFKIIKSQIPLWIVMSTVTVSVSYFLMKKDAKNNTKVRMKDMTASQGDKTKAPLKVKLMSVIVPLIFLSDVFFIYRYRLKGASSTALIGGTAIFIMIISTIIKNKFESSFEKVSSYIKNGFTFGMKIFAPVIVIGAFFFMGSEETASQIFGTHQNGFLTDIGIYIAYRIHLSKFSAVIMQSFISGMLGVGGSGFSGLPLIGSLSKVFSSSTGLDTSRLAALGQIITIWVGGGTIIPWSAAPIAGICNVSPFEVVRKNLIPVSCGFLATIITAILLI